MEETTKHPTMPTGIAKRLLAAQRGARDVEKDSTNKHHRYAYASADDIAAEARRALNEAGLALTRIGWVHMPWTEQSPARIRPLYLLVSDEGETWELPEITVPVLPGDGRPEDKAEAAALTYASGYVALGLLQIERVDPKTGVDSRNDDGYRREQERPQSSAKWEVKIPKALKETATADQMGAWMERYADEVPAEKRAAFKSAVRSHALTLGCPEKADGWLGIAEGGGSPAP